MTDLFVTCKTFYIRESNAQSEVFKTKVLRKPSEGWNETHSICIPDLISVRLLFQVYEWKALGSNQKLLESSISIGSLLEISSQELWISFPGTIFQLHVDMKYTQFFKTKIKGATVAKVIEKISPPNRKDRDRDLMYEFLLTYQMFTTSQHLLDLLIERFSN
jgi:Ca2+-dependent lipid-binding protein